jgi:hypothetical protein
MNRKLSAPRRLLRSLTIVSLLVSASVPYMQAQDDTTAPVLVGFGISPQQVNTSSTTAQVTFSFHVTDDLSAVTMVTVGVLGPSGKVNFTAAGSLVSGTALNGNYQAVLDLPAHSESGTWSVPWVEIMDNVRNLRDYSTAQLQAAGFPVTFTNVLASPYKAYVQPPINSNDSSVFSAKRGVVPVKFTVVRDDVPICTIADATISVARIAGTSTAAIDEASYLRTSDSGSYFRVDPTACQYIYNLSVSSFGVGTYRVNISIDGVVVGSAVLALK